MYFNKLNTYVTELYPPKRIHQFFLQFSSERKAISDGIK